MKPEHAGYHHCLNQQLDGEKDASNYQSNVLGIELSLGLNLSLSLKYIAFVFL